MYYLFEPLMEDGKQVVRIPKKYEHYVDPYGYPTEMWVDEEELKKCSGGDEKYQILTMKKFPSDPFEEIRRVYEKYRGYDEDVIGDYKTSVSLWQAIVKTMERLEGK